MPAVDAATGYIHTITAMAANTHDIVETHNLIREDDRTVYADSGYHGITKRDEIKEEEHLSQIDYHVAMRPSQLRIAPTYEGINWDRKIEHDKSSIRCKVEHPFHIVKNVVGARKAIYRGLKKNFCEFNTLFASANLLMCIRAGRQKDFFQSLG